MLFQTQNYIVTAEKHTMKNYINHLTVNHSQNYKNLITQCHTNTIESNLAGIKMHISLSAKCKKRVYLNLVRYLLLHNETTIH